MVRTYKRKTERESINEEDMKAAITEVLSKKSSFRQAADKHNVKVGTLQNRIQRIRVPFKDNEASTSSNCNNYSSKYSVAQVFSTQQEKMLTDYLLNFSKNGLSLKNLMSLAFEFAEHSGCKFPKSWKVNKCAGIDWALGFKKRNRELVFRKSKSNCIERSLAFNKTAITEFFDNYERVLASFNCTPSRIINLGETQITTVSLTPKVLSEKKQKRIGQIASAERGELVTFCGIITATGTIPPVYVFPCVHFEDTLLNGAPEGSLGLANQNGLMTAELHVHVLNHIQQHTSCSKDNPIIIICKSQESHISIEADNYCRENGINYLSLPLNTLHKLQPLDVSIFGTFKSKLKTALNDWDNQNVGQALSIYNISVLTKSAFLESFTPQNITKGFSKPGIWPCNRLAFRENEFGGDCSQPQPQNLDSTLQIVDKEIRLDLEKQEVDFMELDQNEVIEIGERDLFPTPTPDPLGEPTEIVVSPKLALSSSASLSNSFPSNFKTSILRNSEKSKPHVFNDEKLLLLESPDANSPFMQIYKKEHTDIDEESYFIDGSENTELQTPNDVDGLSSEGIKSSMRCVSEFNDDSKVFINSQQHQYIEENRHVLFNKSILPSLNNFNEEETLDFQIGVLNLIKNIKSKERI